MTERIVENMSMEEAFKALNDTSVTVQRLNEALYKDTSGIMGELDATYSVDDLKAAWEEGKDSDPSMLEYDDFDNWLEDTLSNMSQIFDDEEFDERTLEEEINSYSYKNYIICHGCHNTDRWYVKDGNDAFVGTKSGYSNEDEALEYVDSLNESFGDGKYCIVAITADGDRKFYKDGEFIDSCKDCTVFTDLDDARDTWSQIDKSEFKRVFVPNWSEDMFCESASDSYELNESVKPESIVNKIVDVIEKSRFTNRSIASTETTITMEDKDGDKTTYTVKVRYIPEFVLEEELVGEICKTIDRDKFIEDSAILIMDK